MPSGQITSPELVAAVKSMLASGTRHKIVAETLGISVKLVERISAGTITGKPRITESNLPKLERTRCPGCGGLIVETPCRACAVREAAAHAHVCMS